MHQRLPKRIRIKNKPRSILANICITNVAANKAKILDPKILGGKVTITTASWIKMIIHETKQEPNKKGSNSIILSKNHPDEHNRQTNGQNTQHEYKYQQNRLWTVSNELLGGGG